MTTQPGAAEVGRDEGQLAMHLARAHDLALRTQRLSSFPTPDPQLQEATNAKLREATRKVAWSFPLLAPRGKSGTKRFHELALNRRGAGFDGFRFRNTSNDPKNLGWMFAVEHPPGFSNWDIAPALDEPMEGFKGFAKAPRRFTRSPWEPERFDVYLQWLKGAEIKPGKEYIIWFAFRDNEPVRFFIGLDLFPAGNDSLSTFFIASELGLGWKPDEYSR